MRGGGGGGGGVETPVWSNDNVKLRKMSQAMCPPHPCRRHVTRAEIWAKLGGFQFSLIGGKSVLEGKLTMNLRDDIF